jgi:D-glycero-D-manno-heptose 1,7-bisphosphate phosphatase
LSEPDKVRPIAGAGRLIARANAIGLPVVVVSNQSRIDRGYYGWSAFAAVQRRLERLVGAEGGRFDAVYACPHLPGGRAGEEAPDSLYRKPGPGMLLRAAEVLNLDLRRSWVVGDAASDLEAGLRAGLCRGWLVPTGHGARDAEAARSLMGAGFEVVVGRSIEALIGELDDLAAL